MGVKVYYKYKLEDLREGMLVSYSGASGTRYAVIRHFKNGDVWGRWRATIEDAKKVGAVDRGYGMCTWIAVGYIKEIIDGIEWDAESN